MDCGTSMVKYILFLFNTLCSICGLVLVVGGILMLNDASYHHGTVHEVLSVQLLPKGLIVLGAIILLISFLGCCGAIRESYCMSMTYAVLLLMLLIVQLVGVVFIWMNKTEISKAMEKIVDKAWEDRNTDPAFMDGIQVGLKCCGVNGPQDYLASLSVPPKTCCPDNQCTLTNMYTRGCKAAFTNFWDVRNDIVKYVGLAIVGIELVGFIFACCLANNIRNYKRRAAY